MLRIRVSIRALQKTCNLSQTLHGYDFGIIFFTRETRILQQAMFSLNNYIIGIASIGLPKVNLWTTKCVT